MITLKPKVEQELRSHNTPRGKVIIKKLYSLEEETASILKSYEKGAILILDLEAMESAEAQRFLDRVTGAALVTGGKVRYFTGSSYLLIPGDIVLEDDTILAHLTLPAEELESLD